MDSVNTAAPAEDRVVPTVRRLAFVFALVMGIGLPGGYFTVDYSRLVTHVEGIAQTKAETINSLVSANPGFWTYDLQRIEELLRQRPLPLVDERATVRDASGRVILTVGELPEAPLLVRSFLIYDSGRVVGRVEIEHSYRSVLLATLVAGLLGLLLGVSVYATLLALPLRALRRVTAELDHEQKLLRTSEANYRLLFDANPHPMWVFDEESLAFLAVNDAAVAKYGWSREEFLRMTLANIRREEDVPALRENLATDNEKKLRKIQFSKHRTKHGTSIDVEINSHIVDFGGRCARVVTAYDVTERKRAEAALRESEQRFRNLLQNTFAVAVQSCGGDGAIQYWNRASELLYGYTEQEAMGRDLVDLIVPPEMRGNVKQAIQQMAKTGQLIPAAERFLTRKDGSRVSVYSSHAVVQIPGRAPELFCIEIDLTERKRVEEALRAAEEQFRSLVEQSIAGIYIIQDGVFAYVNPRFAEIRGYGSADEMIGLDPLPLIVEKDRGGVAENMRRLLAGETRSISYNFTALRKDGSSVDTGVNSSLATYHGRPAIIGLMQDISEKKRAEEQINHYVAQLENAFMQAVNVATTLSEMRDPYTAGHERRVAEIAFAIGIELGFDARRAEGLRVAGYLHDIGKITIPAEILAKPTKLTPIEYQLIQGHPQASYDVLKSVEFPWPVAKIALQHHERMDGTGYPQGLKGDAILLEARILAVADVIEAMSSHRPYRPGLGIEKALAEIERGRSTAYDPAVADACLRLFREGRYQLPA